MINAINGAGGARERTCEKAANADEEDEDEDEDGAKGATEAAEAVPRRRNLGFGFGSAVDVGGLALDSGKRLLPGNEGIVLDSAQFVVRYVHMKPICGSEVGEVW